MLLLINWFPIQSNAQETEIYNNGNIASVINNPDNPTVFNLEHPTFISYLSTYHWNFANGTVPGTIALRSDEGVNYGPWIATGRDGQGNVVGANWDTHPNILLPKGVYTVIDSDPTTWSQNSGSGNKGFVTVRGVVLTHQIVKTDNQSPVTLFNNNNTSAVLNAPTSPTQFEIKESALITFISTYHWNFGSGATPGILSLQNEQGVTFGPWTVTPRDGQNNTPNANWDARPYEILPPGVYHVIDSDPDTWSRNTGSGNKGFANIQGLPLSSGTTSFQKEFELALGLKTQWTLSGESNWFSQSSETQSGETALQSGSVGHNQVSGLQTTVQGPGELSFFWKASTEQARDLFVNQPKIATILGTLIDVGLGYIKLGQSALTLSGGEAQRVKLARELAKRETGRTLYLLDEPTTGLHFQDIQKLLTVLHQFVEAGHSVIVIEHNLDVIKVADWIIDLGPEGGHAGGQIIAEGSPEKVAKCKGSYTGAFLKETL